MKLKYLKQFVAILAFPLVLTSCELFGLDFQEAYEYDYDAGIPNNQVNMSAFDFIHSRQDIFSLLYEAILYAGVENSFKEANVTYLLPTNTAFNSETASDLSYFQTHMLSYFDEELGQYVTYAPISMTAYPKETVKEFLLYHIVRGKYSIKSLPAEPTWYETLAPADTAKVNMYILKDRNPNLTFNNFSGHYKSTIKPRTANLVSSDGSFIHVLDSWLNRPTQSQLKIK